MLWRSKTVKKYFLQFLLTLGSVFVLLATAAGCVPAEEILRYDPESGDMVRIGVLLPLTGKDAPQGRKMLNGARFAADELNSSRGHFGRQVDLVVVDTGSTGAGAVKAFETAVGAGAVGIVGGYSTVEAREITHLARQHRVPLVLTMATGNDDVIGMDPFVFRTVFTDKQQSEMIAGFMKYYRRVSRIVVAVSAEASEIYSRNVARDVAGAFRELGGEVACVCTIDEKSPDKALREAVSYLPDAIVLPFGAEVAALYYKKLRQLGFAGLICGPDSWDSPLFFKGLTGLKTPGNSFYTAFYSDEAKHAEFSDFRENFRKKRYYYPDSFEIQTYDAVNMLLVGFGNNADSLKKFQKNWLSMRKYSGAAAVYTMERGGRIDRTIYINRVGYTPESGNRPVSRNIGALQYSRLSVYDVEKEDTEKDQDL